MVDTDKFLDDLRNTWPSTIVARSHFDRFSGYTVSPKTIANLESLGQGPRNKFFVGGKAAYPLDDAIDFLRSRICEKGGE